jgi:hypothetical protein
MRGDDMACACTEISLHLFFVMSSNDQIAVVNDMVMMDGHT